MSEKTDICTVCRDRLGFPKQGYLTRKSALEAVHSSPPQKRKFLRVYPCPYSTMWHITFARSDS